MSRRALLIALALLASLTPASAQGAHPRTPLVTDLRIDGDSGTWTAETTFKLRWTLEAKEDLDPVVDVALRLLGPRQEELATFVVPVEDEDLIEGGEGMSATLTIPPGPGGARPVAGTYTVEAWARGMLREGPAERVTLALENRQPGPAVPRLDAAWHRADVAPVLRIAHPPEPVPESGIRGYAIALHPGGSAPPCAGAERCSPQETDLAGGIDDDTLSLGLLPEGDYVVSVVAVSNTGMRSPTASNALVRVDATRPDLSLEGGGSGWSNRPVRVVARATDHLSGMAASGPAGPRTWLAVDGGVPTVFQGPEAATTVSGSGVHSLAAGARDAAGNARGEDAASPPLVGLVRIDEEAPTVAFSRAAGPEDPELIEALVTDPLSGPAATGGSIGLRPQGSDQAFEALPTSSAQGRLSARWNSDDYPPGSYEFRVSGYDGAGNFTSSTRQRNGQPLVLANPVKVPSIVRFGFGARQLVWHRCVRRGEGRRCRREVIEPFERRPAARTVPYGRSVQVGGQVISAAGAPLAGVAVELVESFDPGSRASTRVTRLPTAGDGTFFARLAPGPSRQVEARFGGSRQLTRSSSPALRLGVQTLVRLRASSTRVAVGGRPVVFSGRVLRRDAPIPAYGRPVQLQFRLPGLPWTEFRTVQTDRLGRFRYPYSFSDDDSRGVRFLFRAYAPPQPGWPYEPAASKPLAITGR